MRKTHLAMTAIILAVVSAAATYLYMGRGAVARKPANPLLRSPVGKGLASTRTPRGKRRGVSNREADRTSSRPLKETPGDVYSWDISPGYRACRIPVLTKVGAAQLVHAGDRVDLLGVYSSGNGESLTRVLAQNIRVLQTEYRKPKQESKNSAGEGTGEEQGIVVALKPAQVQRVVAAQAMGKLVVSLRGEGDLQEEREGLDSLHLSARAGEAGTETKPSVPLAAKQNILPPQAGRSLRSVPPVEALSPPVSVVGSSPLQAGAQSPARARVTTLAPKSRAITVVRGTEKVMEQVPDP